jgi:hypothetical protein
MRGKAEVSAQESLQELSAFPDVEKVYGPVLPMIFAQRYVTPLSEQRLPCGDKVEAIESYEEQSPGGSQESENSGSVEDWPVKPYQSSRSLADRTHNVLSFHHSLLRETFGLN